MGSRINISRKEELRRALSVLQQHIKPPTMKIITLAFILPMASAQGPECPDFKDPECVEGQMLCPGSVDFYSGCQFAGYCMDQYDSWAKDYDGNPCPNSCYVECNWSAGEISCPNPSPPGCYNSGSFCVPKPSEFCWPTCPVTCEEGYIFVPGTTNSMGCEEAGYCQWCQQYPETTCMEGQFKCPGPIGWDNCPQPDYCSTQNDGFMSSDGVWTTCPPVCPIKSPCKAGEFNCDLGYDSNGCWMGTSCLTECPETKSRW